MFLTRSIILQFARAIPRAATCGPIRGGVVTRSNLIGHYLGQMREIYGLLIKREVKVVFVSVVVHKHAKKRTQYPAILTEQAWSIKDLLYGIKHQTIILILRERARNPEWDDSSILPSRVANHSAGFGSSCPLTELVI